MREHLPDWEPEWPDGGLSVWCRLPAPISTALAVVAPDVGIRLAAGPRFGVGGAFEQYLRLPFTLPPEQLETAVLALRSAQDRLERLPAAAAQPVVPAGRGHRLRPGAPRARPATPVLSRASRSPETSEVAGPFRRLRPVAGDSNVQGIARQDARRGT